MSRHWTLDDVTQRLLALLLIGLVGWLTSSAIELAGRRLTHWLPGEGQ